MSKSLGNVLDPFEVIERFGADALRFYLLREVPFGQDGSVSTASFEQRYESELANELGNLAERTLAMVQRYRDGVVPAVEPDPVIAEDFAGLRERVAELIDGVRADASRSMRSGSACAGSTATSRSRRRGSSRRTRPARRSSIACSPRSSRGSRARGAAASLPAREHRRAARRARTRGVALASARGWSTGASARRWRTIDPLFPKGLARRGLSRRVQRRDRQPHPSRPVRARPHRRARRAAAGAGVARMLTIGIDGASCRAALAAADAFPQVYAAVGRHPNEAQRLRRRRPGRPTCACGARALSGDRRDGSRLLPRHAPHCRPGARFLRADRAGARAGKAARDPLPRGGGARRSR